MNGDDFWNARPVLSHARRFARARMVSPNGLLVSLIARAIAAAPPGMVLPATIGDHASLNLAAVFVGPSGFGKGAVEAAARSATNLPAVTELPIGSGEGIARTFAADISDKARGKDDEDPNDEPATTAAIFTASEVDGLAAIASRQGSTVLSTFRAAISGETLGAANAQKHTRVHVPGHSYRCCFLIGAQPEKAEPLLRDTAGTVQRLLWVDTTDPDAPDQRPTDPGPVDMTWHADSKTAGSWWEWAADKIANPPTRDIPGQWERGRLVIALPDEAITEMVTVQRAKLRGIPGADLLDGHALLTRAKVAAGLMLLDRRTQVIESDDWDLAGQIMAESDRVRTDVAARLRARDRDVTRARAHAAAEADEIISDRKLGRAKEAVVRWLERHGELARRDLQSKLKADIRSDLPAALAELVDAGQVIETPATPQGGTRYTLAPRCTAVPPVQPPSSQVRGGVPQVQRCTPDEPVQPNGQGQEPPQVQGVPPVQGASVQVSDHVPQVQGVPRPTCERHLDQRLGPTGRCGSCIAESWNVA